MTQPTITAIRRFKGSKQVLDVTIDGVTQMVGGQRVARAQAIIVTDWHNGQKGWGIEVRGDLHKAQNEAARNTAGGPRSHGGYKYVSPGYPSFCVPVTDAPMG